MEKNAELRDKISQDAGGAFCFEMEAAGLMNDFRCIVLRAAMIAFGHYKDDWHVWVGNMLHEYVAELGWLNTNRRELF